MNGPLVVSSGRSFRTQRYQSTQVMISIDHMITEYMVRIVGSASSSASVLLPHITSSLKSSKQRLVSFSKEDVGAPSIVDQ